MRTLPLFFALALSGCLVVDFSEGQSIATEKMAQIVPGTTTKKDILDWFGSPQGMPDGQFLENYLIDRGLAPGPVVDLPFADVLVYRLTRGKGLGIVTIVWNRFDFHIKSDTLVVFFDANDRVLYYGYRKGTDELTR
jgi:hypothetical protein